MVAIYLGRQLGGHKHEEIGKTVGLGKNVVVSSAYLLMLAAFLDLTPFFIDGVNFVANESRG